MQLQGHTKLYYYYTITALVRASYRSLQPLDNAFRAIAAARMMLQGQNNKLLSVENNQKPGGKGQCIFAFLTEAPPLRK